MNTKIYIFILLFSLIISSPPTNIGVCEGMIYIINDLKGKDGHDTFELKANYIEKTCKNLKYAMHIDEVFCEMVEAEGIFKTIEILNIIQKNIRSNNYFC
jgi:hypothetical protein